MQAAPRNEDGVEFVVTINRGFMLKDIDHVIIYHIDHVFIYQYPGSFKLLMSMRNLIIETRRSRTSNRNFRRCLKIFSQVSRLLTVSSFMTTRSAPSINSSLSWCSLLKVWKKINETVFSKDFYFFLKAKYENKPFSLAWYWQAEIWEIFSEIFPIGL